MQNNNNTGKKIQLIEIWKPKFAQALLSASANNTYYKYKKQDTKNDQKTKKYTNKAGLDTGKGC